MEELIESILQLLDFNIFFLLVPILIQRWRYLIEKWGHVYFTDINVLEP